MTRLIFPQNFLQKTKPYKLTALMTIHPLAPQYLIKIVSTRSHKVKEVALPHTETWTTKIVMNTVMNIVKSTVKTVVKNVVRNTVRNTVKNVVMNIVKNTVKNSNNRHNTWLLRINQAG